MLAEPVTVFLCGDVMLGRGIDQIHPNPVDPVLREPYVTSALDYLALAERAHGPIPRAVEPEYVWGDALELLREVRPRARIINLETSITDGGEFWPKTVNYRMAPQHAEVLTAAGIDCCARLPIITFSISAGEVFLRRSPRCETSASKVPVPASTKWPRLRRPSSRRSSKVASSSSATARRPAAYPRTGRRARISPGSTFCRTFRKQPWRRSSPRRRLRDGRETCLSHRSTGAGTGATRSRLEPGSLRARADRRGRRPRTRSLLARRGDRDLLRQAIMYGCGDFIPTTRASAATRSFAPIFRSPTCPRSHARLTG